MDTKYLDYDFYLSIKSTLLHARHKVYSTASFEMVNAYWEIGKSIVENKMEMIEVSMEED